jgi:NitT/TauT family transport system substrate-binding protein
MRRLTVRRHSRCCLGRRADAGHEIYETRPDRDLICFGEVVTREPFLLTGREPRPDFTLADPYGRRLARVSEVPTPWLYLQENARRAGLDPDALPRITGSTMVDNATALRQGEVDVVQLF